MHSGVILERLTRFHKGIDLSLRPGYHRLLQALGNPHHTLPPTIHVAGTNGKGSTIAFMRAMLEAAGKRVHAYTSPHLVSFHERIRLAGELISEEALCNLLEEVEDANAGNPVTFFEITTAVAFLAFTRTPADALLLEAGMGGRLDATNVIETPAATIITRLSYDHREFLGHTIGEIATEKAGIFKKGVPAIIAPQAEETAMHTLLKKADEKGTPCLAHGRDWFFDILADGSFTLHHEDTALRLPRPNLLGTHQYANAATAVVALRAAFPVPQSALRKGIGHATWPARLQRLVRGPLVEALPIGTELWLDGGHNDSAGEALATQATLWARDSHALPLVLIYGMLASKNPVEFLTPLAPHLARVYAVPMPDEKGLSAENARQVAEKLGLKAAALPDTAAAITDLAKEKRPFRILIAGSLYLAGAILAENG